MIKIFYVFKRLPNRQEFKGSGIGLVITKLLIEKLGGTVSMESKVNQETTIILNIPNAMPIDQRLPNLVNLAVDATLQ